MVYPKSQSKLDGIAAPRQQSTLINLGDQKKLFPRFSMQLPIGVLIVCHVITSLFKGFFQFATGFAMALDSDSCLRQKRGPARAWYGKE